MNTPQQPGTDVTVAKQEQAIEAGRLLELAQGRDERVQVWETMSAVRQGRVIREASETIGEFSWGAKLSPLHRAALARFAYAMGTDPVRHWIVLGNSVYDKAELWLDLVTSEPDYHHHEIQHINDDKRLSEEKRAARAELRAEWNMPDTAGVCIVTIVVMRHGELIDFADANHAGNRTGYSSVRKTVSLILDPIGEQDPGKTAMTRAFRRAAKKTYPLWRFKRDIPKNEGLNVAELARDDLQASIAHEAAEAKRLQTGNPKLDGTKRFMTVPGADGLQIADTTGDRVTPLVDPYEHGLPELSTIKGIVKTGEPDPYHLDASETTETNGEGKRSTDGQNGSHEQSQAQEPASWAAARKRGGPYAMELPWGPARGTPLDVLSSDHLGRLLKWIRSSERQSGLLEKTEDLIVAIGEVLEDRRGKDAVSVATAGSAHELSAEAHGDVALICPACLTRDSAPAPAERLPCSAECGTDLPMVPEREFKTREREPGEEPDE